MDKKHITGLTFLLSILLTSTSFANRPAEFEAPVETVAVVDDSRPASEHAPETVTEKMAPHLADVLDMPLNAAAQTIRKLNFPRRGMTEDKVKNELGRPLEIIPAVGKPPISQWVYNDRIVYFEYSSVVHVVAK